MVRVVPPHGTRARYGHRDPEIRCRGGCPASPSCTDANTRYERVYRAEGPTTFTRRADGNRQLRLTVAR